MKSARLLPTTDRLHQMIILALVGRASGGADAMESLTESCARQRDVAGPGQHAPGQRMVLNQPHCFDLGSPRSSKRGDEIVRYSC